MANKRRNPPAQWPLPDVVDPAERLCVRVYVPNDPAHIAAFRGALLALQSAYHWADDPTHKAKDVALVWREILRDMGTDNWGCGIDSIEFRQVGNCEIQYRIDGGAWTHMATLYDCAYGAILDALSDGVIAAPSQQPAGGIVPGLQCETYRITLRADQPWKAPNPVSAGYTITVDSAEGAWSDNNTVLSNWFCPAGTSYGLGQCGNNVAALPGDPLQSANHMRVVGFSNNVWMDMYNTTYVVPQGTPTSAFFLQANDGSLSDNAGEIRLNVTICNYGAWQKYWTASDADFIVYGAYGVKDGSDFLGTGWPGLGRNQLEAIINQQALPGTTITKVRAEYSTDNAWDTYVMTWPEYTWRWTWNQVNGSHLWAQDDNPVFALSNNGTLSIRMTAHNNGVIRLHRFEVYGSGNILPGGHAF